MTEERAHPAAVAVAAEPFVGRFEHALDDKGRIVLPASFRSHFETAGFVTKSSEGCLALVTPARFSQIAAEMVALASDGGSSRRAAKRAFGASAARVNLDKQGRFAIPEELRRFAGLVRDCVVAGAIDAVELWDATRWAAINQAGEALLVSPEGD